MKKLLTTLISLVILASVNAQDSLQTQVLDGVTVIGVRADSKTPVTQKTVNRSAIDSTYQGEEMPILMDKTPSVTSQSDGGHQQGYTTFRLRGIDQTRINMTLNGVPLNEPEDQGVYTSNYPNFINNVKSFQIQRGVGTSTNGVASYAGSINFESEVGVDKKTEVQLGLGPWATQRIMTSLSSGVLDSKMCFYGSMSHYATDGYKYHSGGSGNSFFLGGGYFGVKNIVKVTGFYGTSVNQMAWLAVSDSAIKSNRRTNNNSIGDNDDFKQGFLQLQYIRILTPNTRLTSTIFYNRLDGNWDLNLMSIGAGTDKLNYKLGSNFYGALVNYNYTKNKVKLNIGVSGNGYDRTHSANLYPTLQTQLYTNTGHKNEIAGFAKLGYDIGNLTFFLDAQERVTNFTYNGDVAMPSQRWGFFNPKGGIVYSKSPTVNYYVSVGQSHREPTRTNMFGGNDNLSVLIPIKPEEVVDYELGLNFKKERLYIQSNLYYMDFKNEITLLGALGSNGLPLMTNVTKSFRSGVELDIEYKLRKGFTLTNNTNYSYNRIVDNGTEFQPLYTPNFIMNQSVKYKYKKFVVIATAKFNSESYINFDNTLKTPSFVVYSLNVGYEYKKVFLMLQGYNLTSVNYYTSGYAVGNTPYYFANAPLSIYTTLKITF